jgi:hypothetical protein
METLRIMPIGDSITRGSYLACCQESRMRESRLDCRTRKAVGGRRCSLIGCRRLGYRLNQARVWQPADGERALAADPDAIDRELERIRPAVEAWESIPAMDHSVPPDVSWENFQYYLKRRAEILGFLGPLGNVSRIQEGGTHGC